ncbi:NADH-cytochrome b5 reductase [Podila minutissima]|uniref:NADH-cytochrome b5 reductase n=1 Tax=Podila minutissima TaxID=64525 RepID=A0A9P5STA5_9FUNG|nr:NADH-cytochrome b5 reductase [Podila minutissima]
MLRFNQLPKHFYPTLRSTRPTLTRSYAQPTSSSPSTNSNRVVKPLDRPSLKPSQTRERFGNFPPPQPPQQPSSAANAITFLAATAIGLGAYFYQWNKHRSFIPGSAGSHGSREGISTESWTPVLLTKITPVSDHTSLFEFELPAPTTVPITSAVYVKDDEIQAMRAYTPIHTAPDWQVQQEGEAGDQVSTVQLLIKRYSEGQVSRFMHSAKPGQRIEMRGPVLIWPGSRQDLEKYDHIGMIAGGTGITAFLPIIHSALSSSEKKVKISLLFASQNPSELYFKQDLDQLAKAHPDQFKVAYAIDRLPTTDGSDAWDGHVGFVHQDMVKNLLPSPDSEGSASDDKFVVLVCGPESMVKHVAGTRGMSGHEPIRGVLGDMGYQRDQVFRFPN